MFIKKSKTKIIMFILALFCITLSISSIDSLMANADSLNDEPMLDTDYNIEYINANIVDKDSELAFESTITHMDLNSIDFYSNEDGFSYYGDITPFIQGDLQTEGVATIRCVRKNSLANYGGALEYFDFTDKNVVEVLYYNSNITKLYKIYGILTDDEFENLTKKALDFDETDENTKEKLTESASFERYYKKQMMNNDINILSDESLLSISSSSYVNQNETVKINQYDKYTNTNGLINDYLKYYMGQQHKCTVSSVYPTSDDPIVNIIPKNLFRSVGTYSYIGLEYGFYINTLAYDQGSNLCEFIVFDIETTQKVTANKGEVIITPLFESTLYYDAELDLVAISDMGKITGTTANLALANIKVTIALNNKDQLNIGDTGYNAFEDYGSYLTTTYVNAVGVGNNNASSSPTLGVVKLTIGTVLGKMPAVGSIIKKASNFIIDTIDNYQTGYITGEYEKNFDSMSNGVYRLNDVMFYGTDNAQTIIRQNGNLPRAYKAEIKNQDVNNNQNALLYKPDKNSYFKLQFGLSSKDDATYWSSIISQQISLDIVEDNTYKVLWLFNAGEVEKKDSVVGGLTYQYNEKPYSEGVKTVIENQWNEALFYFPNTGEVNLGYQDFIFTPKSTSKYMIAGKGTYSFILKDYNDQTLVSIDHYSYTYPYYINLTAGQTYKIRVYGMSNSQAGCCEFFIGKYSDNLNVLSSTYDISTPDNYDGQSIWYSFTPTRSDIYAIQTINQSANSCDTYLEIYDDDFNLLSFDDDSGTGLYSLINLYLRAGQEYFIKARNFVESSTSTFSVAVSISQTIALTKISKYNYEYQIDAGGSIYFKFTPVASGNYIIEDSKDYDNGNLDTYLTLLDGQLQFISYDDDSGEGLKASLNVYLNADTTYYIQLRMYSQSVSGNGCLSVWKV